MKNIIINNIVLLMTLSSLAQNIVKPIETKWSTNFLASNTDFKDVNGELNKFIGVWRYEDTSTNTIFEITFYKEENISGLRNCTFDRLNANFKLIQSGIEQYNTYTIDYGKTMVAGGFYVKHIYDSMGNVTELPPSTNRYHMSIVEPNFLDDIDASDLTITYENNLGIEKLNWVNKIDKSIIVATGLQANVYQMPLEMILIKQ